jgi:hypothetical protein
VPAAAVIPAPIACTKVVAVKKLVVELLVGVARPWLSGPVLCAISGHPPPSNRRSFTVKKLGCFKQKLFWNMLVWDDKIGSRRYFVGLHVKRMINRDSWGYSYLDVRGEILGLPKDELLRKHLPRMFSLIKNESEGIEDD